LIDIILVAYLFYKLYMLIKGTVAINIFFVIAIIYFIWIIVRALNMQLLSTILGQFIGVGVLAIVIVFQQEIRRFFLLIYSEYLSKFNFSIENMFSNFIETPPLVNIDAILKAAINMSESKTGGTIVVSSGSKLSTYTNTGVKLDADTSADLIETIFFKNSPLHDGAIIIVGDKIVAAGCILPVSEDFDVPQSFGLRHRSGLGISEATNALTIVISEETGSISYFKNSKYDYNVSVEQLHKILIKDYIEKYKKTSQKYQNPLRSVNLNPFKN